MKTVRMIGIDGITLTEEKGSTQRKPSFGATCPPQTPHRLLWDRTSGSAVASRRLIACRDTVTLENWLLKIRGTIVQASSSEMF